MNRRGTEILSFHSVRFRFSIFSVWFSVISYICLDLALVGEKKARNDIFLTNLKGSFISHPRSIHVNSKTKGHRRKEKKNRFLVLEERIVFLVRKEGRLFFLVHRKFAYKTFKFAACMKFANIFLWFLFLKNHKIIKVFCFF